LKSSKPFALSTLSQLSLSDGSIPLSTSSANSSGVVKIPKTDPCSLAFSLKAGRMFLYI